MYPAYTLSAVLDLKYKAFVALLSEGYRIKHQHYLMLVNIGALPNVKHAEDRDRFIRQLEYASKDPEDDILESSDDYSGIADVKRVLGL